MKYFYIDTAIAEIMVAALKAANKLEEDLGEINASSHADQYEFEIAFRYAGEEWFVVSQNTGEWFEVVHSEERTEQIARRIERDG